MSYVWVVYAAHSNEGVTAMGSTGDEGAARSLTEDVLRHVEAAGFGLVVSPDMRQDSCRRDGAGGFTWRPLYAAPPTAK